MSSNLVRYKLKEGDKDIVVTFETETDKGRGEELLSRDDDEIPEAEERFDDLVRRIRPVADTLLNALADFNRPQEVNLEFGVKLNAKAGIVFASAASECNFKVGLKWTNPPSTD